MTVTVAIPTYGHRAYVLETLESVFAQTLPDVEVIVVNDGSPDDTAAVLRPLIDAGRIRYVEQPNAGQAAARNRCVELARGEFLAFLDDDDVWPADHLEAHVAALRADPAVVVSYGYATLFGRPDDPGFPRNGAPTGDVRADFLRGCWMTSPGQAVMRTAAVRAVGGFDPSLWGTDDWDFYIRLAGRGPFVYLPRRSLFYRSHADNASRDTWRMYVNCQRLLAKHCGRLPRPSTVRDWVRLRRWITGYAVTRCFDQADELWRTGRRGAAARLWTKALIARPERVRTAVGRLFGRRPTPT